MEHLAARFLTALAGQALQVVDVGTDGRLLVDVDDTVIQLFNHGCGPPTSVRT